MATASVLPSGMEKGTTSPCRAYLLLIQMCRCLFATLGGGLMCLTDTHRLLPCLCPLPALGLEGTVLPNDLLAPLGHLGPLLAVLHQQPDCGLPATGTI